MYKVTIFDKYLVSSYKDPIKPRLPERALCMRIDLTLFD